MFRFIKFLVPFFCCCCVIFLVLWYTLSPGRWKPMVYVSLSLITRRCLNGILVINEDKMCCILWQKMFFLYFFIVSFSSSATCFPTGMTLWDVSLCVKFFVLYFIMFFPPLSFFSGSLRWNLLFWLLIYVVAYIRYATMCLLFGCRGHCICV